MESIERVKPVPDPYPGAIAVDFRDVEDADRVMSPDEKRDQRAKLIEMENRIFQARLS